MNSRQALLAAALLGLVGCARFPLSSQPSVTQARQSPVPPANAPDSRRDIVLAVANPLVPPPLHAGSNLLGYAASKQYVASQRAASTLDKLARQYGLREVTAWPIKPLNLYCAVLEPPAGASREKLIEALAKDGRVALAQPLQSFSVYSDAPANKPATTPGYNDPYVGLQRGFIATDAAAAQAFASGHGVDVAIVDTGVDTSHPDLKGRVLGIHNLVDADRQAFESDHHGTEVAGIIAADRNNHLGIVGMAPQAMLSVYKACWYSPRNGAGIARCDSFTLAKALVAVIDSPARIVNLSLGGPADPLLQKLLVKLLYKGRIVIAALPPSGSVGGFPDDTPGVITVRTSAASTAPAGVLSAPGNDILTTQPNGGYDFTSGSSMAAAHVSGIVALLLSISPDLNAKAIHHLLLQTSRTSGGLLQVNAEAALDALRNGEGHPR